METSLPWCSVSPVTKLEVVLVKSSPVGVTLCFMLIGFPFV